VQSTQYDEYLIELNTVYLEAKRKNQHNISESLKMIFEIIE